MPMFERRHYEAIAEMIRIGNVETYNDLIEGLIRLFRNDNPNFSENKFHIACAGYYY